eukprot:scaffold10848_cov57-Phaeocystis_antarctica.AAC.12
MARTTAAAPPVLAGGAAANSGPAVGAAGGRRAGGAVGAVGAEPVAVVVVAAVAAAAAAARSGRALVPPSPCPRGTGAVRLDLAACGSMGGLRWGRLRLEAAAATGGSRSGAFWRRLRPEGAAAVGGAMRSGPLGALISFAKQPDPSATAAGAAALAVADAGAGVAAGSQEGASGAAATPTNRHLPRQLPLRELRLHLTRQLIDGRSFGGWRGGRRGRWHCSLDLSDRRDFLVLRLFRHNHRRRFLLACAARRRAARRRAARRRVLLGELLQARGGSGGLLAETGLLVHLQIVELGLEIGRRRRRISGRGVGRRASLGDSGARRRVRERGCAPGASGRGGALGCARGGRGGARHQVVGGRPRAHGDAHGGRAKRAARLETATLALGCGGGGGDTGGGGGGGSGGGCEGPRRRGGLAHVLLIGPTLRVGRGRPRGTARQPADALAWHGLFLGPRHQVGPIFVLVLVLVAAARSAARCGGSRTERRALGGAAGCAAAGTNARREGHGVDGRAAASRHQQAVRRGPRRAARTRRAGARPAC